MADIKIQGLTIDNCRGDALRCPDHMDVEMSGVTVGGKPVYVDFRPAKGLYAPGNTITRCSKCERVHKCAMNAKECAPCAYGAKDGEYRLRKAVRDVNEGEG